MIAVGDKVRKTDHTPFSNNSYTLTVKEVRKSNFHGRTIVIFSETGTHLDITQVELAEVEAEKQDERTHFERLMDMKLNITTAIEEKQKQLERIEVHINNLLDIEEELKNDIPLS